MLKMQMRLGVPGHLFSQTVSTSETIKSVAGQEFEQRKEGGEVDGYR